MEWNWPNIGPAQSGCITGSVSPGDGGTAGVFPGGGTGCIKGDGGTAI